MYNINDKFYVFGLGCFVIDLLVDDLISLLNGEIFGLLDGCLKCDVYLGFGLGYCVINNDIIVWCVQVVVGVCYIKVVDVIEDLLDLLIGMLLIDLNIDVGYLVLLCFYYCFMDMVFVMNDIDYLILDVNDMIMNELGVNFKMFDVFVICVFYKIEYVLDRNICIDNMLGVLLVYGF